MNTTDPTKLDGRDLDAAVAERLFGVRIVGQATCVNADGSWSVFADTDPGDWGCRAYRGPVIQDGDDLWAGDDDAPKIDGVSVYCLKPVPPYSTDRNAASQVLDEIEKRGLQIRFIDHLGFLVKEAAEAEIHQEECFAYLIATPADICRAALLAIGESDAKA